MPNPNETIKGLRASLEKAEQERDEALKDLAASQDELADTQADFDATTKAAELSAASIAEIQADLERQSAELEAARKEVTKLTESQSAFDAKVAEKVADLTGTAPPQDVAPEDEDEGPDNVADLSYAEKAEKLTKITDPAERNRKAIEWGLRRG